MQYDTKKFTFMPYNGKITGISSLAQSFLLTSKNEGDILDI